MSFLPFFTAPNLVADSLTEAEPWEFSKDDADNPLKRLTKPRRRALMLKPDTQWQVYSSFRGFARNQRISKANPPAAMRGLVVDYDTVMDVDTMIGFINGELKDDLAPTWLETSLSGKSRLVWCFEKEILLPSTEFAIELLKGFITKLGLENLAAGYDKASEKPAEMWTNGGTWYSINPGPLSWTYCFGVVCDVSKKTSLFQNGEISLDVIADEVTARFPGRWRGDFKLDAQGVRFWDESADNPTGCQVKPDGMLCFTGNEPFVNWSAIFGRQWVEEKRILNLGKAGESLYFDGQIYWEYLTNRWVSVGRADAMLRLKNRGLSDKAPKGASASDVERVMNHIQLINRVEGAAPMVNYKPGLLDLEGRRILNIANLQPVLPVKGPTGDVEKDCPWLWPFITGLFTTEGLPYALAWLKRSYRSQLEFQRLMGQAFFLCGPKDNGKTLFIMRIVVPLLGNRSADPYDYLTGDTIFTDNLFESPVLAINDSDSPRTESIRQKMLAHIKALTVNPMHTYHPKFRARLTIEWIPRFLCSLNNDPGSTGILPEVGPNTRDKMMFFQSRPFKGAFPERGELESIISRELPHFGQFLYDYQPPEKVLAQTRMGIREYYDPQVLQLAYHQTHSSNLYELLILWMREDAFWAEDNKNTEWTGTPTELLSALQTCSATEGIAHDWTQQKIAQSLTSLAKQEGSGITFASENGRDFKITR